MDLREYITSAVYTRDELEAYLDPDIAGWSEFHPELGYVLGDCVVRDGIDGSSTLSSVEPGGQRRQVNYATEPCRVNTYGDSMTQCHQVSDGETWQEHLAAHLGEPLRNFGVGGYGVYQAYRRLLTEEKRTGDASVVMFNVFSEDHMRSLDPWRWLRLEDFRGALRAMGSESFSVVHGNPWPYIRIDLSSGEWEEKDNPFNTAESLYQLCDADFVYDFYADEPIVHVLLASSHGVLEERRYLDQLAEALEVSVDWSSETAIRRSARRLHERYGWAASQQILDWLQHRMEQDDKALLLLLTYAEEEIAAACEHQSWRPDEEFFRGATSFGWPTNDVLASHRADFAQFRISGEAYTARYLEGHYTPAGTQFYAFSVKDDLLSVLDPPPPAYLDQGLSLQDVASGLA